MDWIAYACRMGHQSMSEVKRWPVEELIEFNEAISRLVEKDQSGGLGG